MTRITLSGANHWQGNRPSRSDADRLHTHGPLQPMDTYVRKQDYRADPSRYWWLAFLIVVAVVAAVLS